MKICFVRHGNYKNCKLTRLGVKQARLVCKELEYERLVKVYASPVLRTKQTAQIIAKKLGIKDIEYCDEIIEREQLRKFDYTPKSLDYNTNYLNVEYSATEPEGTKEFCDRIFKFLDKIISKHYGKDENVLIIGHSSMTYVLNAYFCGIPKDNNLVWMRLGNCSKLMYEVNKKE